MATKNDGQATLADYWSGIHEALNKRLRSVQKFLRHPTSGGNAEDHIRQLLRDYLPTRYAVENGFVVNADQARSDAMDILFVDKHFIPPLSAEPAFKVFPCEAVVGALEMTSSPKSQVGRAGIGKISKLQDDIMKLARLRGLAKERQYASPVFGGSGAYHLSPRSYLITFGDEWKHADTFEGNLTDSLRTAKGSGSDVWVNAAFSFAHGLYVFKPYSVFEYDRVTANSLLEFVFLINEGLRTVPTAAIDLRRYRPSIPSEELAQPGDETGARIRTRA
jgi:hypothetical protein